MDRVKEYKEEVDLLLLGKDLLKKWKSIIVITLIFAIISLVFGYFTYDPSEEIEADTSQEKSDEPVIPYEEQVKAYEIKLKTYEDSVAEYENEIAEYESDIETYRQQIEKVKEDRDDLDTDKKRIYLEKEALDKYRETSVLLNIDPYKVTKLRKSYYVSVDDNSDILVGDIIKAYIDSADMANISLNESLGEVSLVIIEGNGNSIVLEAIGNDEKQAGVLLDNAVKAIEGSEKRIISEIGEHKITLKGSEVYVTFDQKLKDAQDNFDNKTEEALKGVNDRMNSYNTQINTFMDKIHNAKAGIIRDNTAIAGLSRPVEPVNSVNTMEEVADAVVKSFAAAEALKSFVLGALIGLFISCAYFGFRYITSGTLKSDDEIKGRYGLRIVGYNDDVSKIPVAVATVIRLMHDEKDLVLAGSVGRDECGSFANSLKEKCPELNIVIAGDISRDADGVIALNSNGKAILIEKVGSSLVKDISYEIEVIRGLGMEIMGYIIG